MNSQTLREARKYEEATEKMLIQEERPDFHLATRIGWMNDPNGFSYYNGKYHMFYQYHPYGPYWGPMYWGHAISDDMLHWENLPAAIAPDEPYDRDGCFSGSAIDLPDGRQLLMYTGVIAFPNANGGREERQTQCVAVGDGVDFVKYEKNPVIGADAIPEGGSKIDFRDPKVFRNSDGTFSCVVGNRPADGSGQILLYRSEDGFNWEFKNTLIKNENRFGKMWECPDFFELDGKWVLLTSPQDMLPQGFEYHNGNGTLCLIGEYDEEKGTFTDEYNQSVDYGIDFYAPQTVLTPDGRRVMIGWMQNWDTCVRQGPEVMWFGQMSLPREIHIKDGRLYQWPIRELDEMRQNKVEYKDVLVEGNISLEGVSGRRVDMEIEIEPVEGEDIFQRFSVRFAKNDTYQTSISLRPHEEVVKVDRKFSGSRRAIIHQRRCKVNGSKNGKIKLRMILDTCSVEVFINNGYQVMTATIPTEPSAKDIAFSCIGKARMNITKYDLVK